MSSEEVIEKLRKYVEEHESERALADKLGYSQPTFNRIVSGKWKKLKEVDDVLKIIGGRFEFDPSRRPDYTFVKKVEARPCAGCGTLETSGKEEGRLAFQTKWLKERTASNPSDLSVMTVTGDSMLPAIMNRDIVLVDEGTAGKELRDGGVYVVRADTEIFIKRYRKVFGKLIFLSDNREYSYQDLEIVDSATENFGVIGRVLWAAREV